MQLFELLRLTMIRSPKRVDRWNKVHWRQLSKLLAMTMCLSLRILRKGIAKGEDPMPQLARGERLQLMLTPDELVLIDDFRFKCRMPSRAAAVRELMKRGLAAEGFDEAAFGSKSGDYGVAGKAPGGRLGR